MADVKEFEIFEDNFLKEMASYKKIAVKKKDSEELEATLKILEESRRRLNNSLRNDPSLEKETDYSWAVVDTFSDVLDAIHKVETELRQRRTVQPQERGFINISRKELLEILDKTNHYLKQKKQAHAC